mgnify:CR=1 FL=1
MFVFLSDTFVKIFLGESLVLAEIFLLQFLILMADIYFNGDQMEALSHTVY